MYVLEEIQGNKTEYPIIVVWSYLGYFIQPGYAKYVIIDTRTGYVLFRTSNKAHMFAFIKDFYKAYGTVWPSYTAQGYAVYTSVQPTIKFTHTAYKRVDIVTTEK